MEWNSRAANADRRNVAGPDIPRCVMSNGPSSVIDFFFFFPGTVFKKKVSVNIQHVQQSFITCVRI